MELTKSCIENMKITFPNCENWIVGDLFPLPKEIEDICIKRETLGGYNLCVIQPTDGPSEMVIVGKIVTPISMAPVQKISIFPTLKEVFLHEESHKSWKSYIFDDDILYHTVFFGDTAFVFDNIQDAMDMAQLLYQVKAFPLADHKGIGIITKRG